MERKNVFICFWKLVDVEHKHIAFVTRSTEKNFGFGHKLRRYSTVPFTLKKIKFCNLRLASCVLDLYSLIKTRYLIYYLQLTRKASEIKFYETPKLTFAVFRPCIP